MVAAGTNGRTFGGMRGGVKKSGGAADMQVTECAEAALAALRNGVAQVGASSHPKCQRLIPSSPSTVSTQVPPRFPVTIATPYVSHDGATRLVCSWRRRTERRWRR
jgi:hypothetical protein